MSLLESEQIHTMAERAARLAKENERLLGLVYHPDTGRTWSAMFTELGYELAGAEKKLIAAKERGDEIDRMARESHRKFQAITIECDQLRKDLAAMTTRARSHAARVLGACFCCTKCGSPFQCLRWLETDGDECEGLCCCQTPT